MASLSFVICQGKQEQTSVSIRSKGYFIKQLGREYLLDYSDLGRPEQAHLLQSGAVAPSLGRLLLWLLQALRGAALRRVGRTPAASRVFCTAQTS